MCEVLPANVISVENELQPAAKHLADSQQPFASAQQHLGHLLAQLGVAEGDRLVVRLLNPASALSGRGGAALRTPPLQHVNLIPTLLRWPPASVPASASVSETPDQAAVPLPQYQLEPFRPDNAADLLLCRSELQDGTMDARLLLLQTLRGLRALHGAGGAHGNLSLSSLLLQDSL